MGLSNARVVGLARNRTHSFSKASSETLRLIAGIGVEGDAHAGQTVQHLSRIRRDPTQPNLRQVHLIHAELLDELATKGFVLGEGDLGENIQTRGIDLLDLPRETRLFIGEAVLRVTGLRNPCNQIEKFRSGLLQHMIEKRADGSIARKCGIMSVVERSGSIATGDTIRCELPPGPHQPLEPV
ncbi:MAG: MOSC domain-containing protein [Tsuneonella troitsensis]